MTTVEDLVERRLAIFMMKKGKTTTEAAQELGRSQSWADKWWHRYQECGWAGLRDRSRTPHCHGTKLPEATRKAICKARSELEVAVELDEGLKYIGSRAVRTKLQARKLAELPSLPSIERVLREAGMTKQKENKVEPTIVYPHLKPTDTHELYQVDIVPHYLRGGQRVPCFNGIDVISRYPTGVPYTRKRSQEAAEFLIHLWQEMGIPTYTQVDNESCFSGGFTHQYVLGKVVRLALEVGTELVFSPVRHPKSNGTVERFHQDYSRHVWEDTYLADLDDVLRRTEKFLALYRQRPDHSALNGQTPYTLHTRQSPTRLPADFILSDTRLPLKEGKIHFIRRVSAEGIVQVLNVEWIVPNFDPKKGVWVTIEFQVVGAKLYIFDQAPDVSDRQCLALYPFPLKEPVQAHSQPKITRDDLSLTILAEKLQPMSDTNVREHSKIHA